jgi:hypothetical protein
METIREIVGRIEEAADLLWTTKQAAQVRTIALRAAEDVAGDISPRAFDMSDSWAAAIGPDRIHLTVVVRGIAEGKQAEVSATTVVDRPKEGAKAHVKAGGSLQVRGKPNREVAPMVKVPQSSTVWPPDPEFVGQIAGEMAVQMAEMAAERYGFEATRD